ncbi:MAG: DUF4214 domain-containing protein [Saccharofermentans sp.]|nr:DUF4214 domain-containing protein [Saccharofermentans sp.]
MRRITAKLASALLAAFMVIGVFFNAAPVNVRADIAANATIINCNSVVNVREYPTNQSAIVGTCGINSRVQVTGTTYADGSDTSGLASWYSITFESNGAVKNGYVAAYYVRRDATGTGPSDGGFESMIANFPESYKPYLRDLHAIHPSWSFTPVYTGYDWNSAITVETRRGGSLISNSANGAWKSKADYSYNAATGQYYVIDASNWVNASPEIVAFYMDPRNSINETAVFQFLDLNYTADNSIPGPSVQGVLNGTFMQGQAANQNNDVINYSDIFADAGNIADINPIFLASHVIQECSKNGSTSSNGATGFYNLYNIGAYSSVISASVLGLNFAQNGLPDPGFNDTYLIPWNTPGRSIVGGAKWIRDNYISRGQGTLYFMRFNFDPAYTGQRGYHQYMTATASVYTEASHMMTAYYRAGLLDTPMSFRIPVYDNMPEGAVGLPANEIAPPPIQQNGEMVGRDPIENFLIYMYRSTLNRYPDTVGLDYWYKQITVDHMTGEEVAYGFVFSQEMTNRNLSDEQYVRILYNAFLGRECDADGLAYWIDKLSNGSSRLDVYHGFSRSDEFINLCNTAGFSPYPGYGT